MNHLAHFVLAGEEPHMIVGSFLGDYVKGRLEGRFNPDIERGIRLHRAIDHFTDQHDIVRRSQRRFDARFRRYGGIMTDIVYDHLLARDFNNYHSTPLPTFSHNVLTTLTAHIEHLPEPAAEVARRMQAANSMAGYDSKLFVERSFLHLGSRLSRDNPLDEAFEECERHLPALARDLSEFYPLLTDFCAAWKKNH